MNLPIFFFFLNHCSGYIGIYISSWRNAKISTNEFKIWGHNSFCSNRKSKLESIFNLELKGLYLLWVYIGRSLVKYKDHIISNYGSRQTDKLSLAHTEVGAPLIDGHVETWPLHDHVFQLYLKLKYFLLGTRRAIKWFFHVKVPWAFGQYAVMCVFFFFFLIIISHIIETFLLLITKIYRKARDINTSIHIIS